MCKSGDTYWLGFCARGTTKGLPITVVSGARYGRMPRPIARPCVSTGAKPSSRSTASCARRSHVPRLLFSSGR